MPNKTHSTFKAASTALLLLSALLLAGMASGAEKPCHQCHASKVSGPVKHAPVAEKDCTACHNSTGGNHQLQKGLFGVKKQGAALCYDCHDNMAKLTSVHAPVKEGDCASCHAPHHSPFKGLLKTPAPTLCFECHDRQKLIGPFPHDPVASGKCADCHLMHQSTIQKLVKPSKGVLCFECHDAAMTNGKSVHMPVADKDCKSCHDPHGSSIGMLLKGVYPLMPESAFSEKAYALCLGCHDKAAFTDDETATATGFRDGKTNLHALHVKGANVTCRMCHNVHAASQAKLIRDSVIGKNKLEILINFTDSKTGGSCKMTCHSPSAYKR